MFKTLWSTNNLILKKVLGCIYEKGYIKADEVSQELGVSRGLVEYAIQKMKDKEYLIPVASLNREASCSFCPLKSTCNIKTAGTAKSYVLTEKGKELLKS